MKAERKSMNAFLKVMRGAVSPAIVVLVARVSAQVPSAIAVSDGAVLVTLHAEGAQIYECKADSDEASPLRVSSLTWQFREPIATLIADGKSTGRHYAGPNWDHVDGSGVKGKVIASAPGATPNDIPWLKLNVVEHRGGGILSSATTVQRINTKGGMLQGHCENAGHLRSVPYSADYVFLRKS
jgi:hypothetical protein